jgi:hypothetical protein
MHKGKSSLTHIQMHFIIKKGSENTVHFRMITVVESTWKDSHNIQRNKNCIVQSVQA